MRRVEQHQQEAAGGTEIAQAREVVIQAAFQPQAQLRRQVAGQRGGRAAAAFQAQDRVEVVLEGVGELRGQAGPIHGGHAWLVGNGCTQRFHFRAAFLRLAPVPRPEPAL
jgi:hypothetical protein